MLREGSHIVEGEEVRARRFSFFLDCSEANHVTDVLIPIEEPAPMCRVDGRDYWRISRAAMENSSLVLAALK